MDRKKFIEYANKHLITAHQARQITGQARASFSQSVRDGHLHPALELKESEKRVQRLFFKDEVEAYYEKIRVKPQYKKFKEQ